MSLDHAKHNEEVCVHLFGLGKFHDWVVTTAFYSALHYVKHKVFPFDEAGRTFNTFEQYLAFKKLEEDKHITLINLCRIHAKDIHGLYKWLHDNCKTARYNDYNVTPQNAKQASDRLDEIRKFCDTKSVAATVAKKA